MMNDKHIIQLHHLINIDLFPILSHLYHLSFINYHLGRSPLNFRGFHLVEVIPVRILKGRVAALLVVLLEALQHI